MADRWRRLDLRERRDPTSRRGAKRGADANQTKGRSEVIQWLFAALNSVEMAALPYSIFKFSGDDEQTAGRQALDAFLAARLGHMEQVLADRTWLTGAFSVADILMSDVLRLVDRFDGLAEYPPAVPMLNALRRDLLSRRPMPIRWSISQPQTDEHRVWTSMQSSDGFGQFMRPDPSLSQPFAFCYNL
jgi:glutathione S-transferase